MSRHKKATFEFAYFGLAGASYQALFYSYLVCLVVTFAIIPEEQRPL